MPVTPHQPGPHEIASVCQETNSNTSEAYLVSDAVFKYSLRTPVNRLWSSRIRPLPQYEVCCPGHDRTTGQAWPSAPREFPESGGRPDRVGQWGLSRKLMSAAGARHSLEGPGCAHHTWEQRRWGRAMCTGNCTISFLLEENRFLGSYVLGVPHTVQTSH